MTEVTYTKVGDYRIPNLIPPDEEPVKLGKYGLMRKKYLQERRRGLFTHLLTSGNLYKHLAEIDQAANDRQEQIVAQMKQIEGVTEELKARDQMAWVGLMNNILLTAEEIIRTELIHN